jgi:hypothetical protein
MVKNAVFPGGCSLSSQNYSSSVDVQKFITIKLFIVSRRVNNHWKEDRVSYNSCMGLSLRF